MNKIKRRYDHMRDDTIDGKYNSKSTQESDVSENKNDVTVEDISAQNLPTATI